MRDDDKDVASRHAAWQLNVPQAILQLYFNHVRVLPSWKRNFPRYIHPAIRDVVELGHNKTMIVTAAGEYVFFFDERNTLVPEAAEYVRTGVLVLEHNNAVVLRLSASPSDSDEFGKTWVARGVEEFKEGDWVAELSQLLPELAAYEAEQMKKEEVSRQGELRSITELKEKFSRLPSAEAESAPWFKRLWRRSGT
jgi:hypothetical protein